MTLDEIIRMRLAAERFKRELVDEGSESTPEIHAAYVYADDLSKFLADKIFASNKIRNTYTSGEE